MTAWSASPMQRVRVALARLQQLVGWAGIAGMVLLVTAAAVGTLAWSAQQAFAQTSAARPQVAASQPTPSVAAIDVAARTMPELPLASDVALLLTQMKQAAIGNGLDWRAAEYRITPATPTQPASLEVRVNIKGPYPKLRGMLVQLKSAIPAFAIREFSASRPNADTPDIDAKLALAVFLQDGALASDASTPATATKGAP